MTARYFGNEACWWHRVLTFRLGAFYHNLWLASPSDTQQLVQGNSTHHNIISTKACALYGKKRKHNTHSCFRVAKLSILLAAKQSASGLRRALQQSYSTFGVLFLLMAEAPLQRCLVFAQVLRQLAAPLAACRGCMASQPRQVLYHAFRTCYLACRSHQEGQPG